MKAKHRIVRHLGRGREAVRCADGRWRVFEVRSVDSGDGPSRRWVCVHVEDQPGRWPYEFFGTEPKKNAA